MEMASWISRLQTGDATLPIKPLYVMRSGFFSGILAAAAGAMEWRLTSKADVLCREVISIHSRAHCRGCVNAFPHTMISRAHPSRMSLAPGYRSEEHTSELQSPYVISY